MLQFLLEVRDAFHELRRDRRQLWRYLTDTEVHTYAFSIAANVLLAFFPFMLVSVAFARHVLHWPRAEQAIYLAIQDYFAGYTGQFLERNLSAAADINRSLEWVSLLLLLFTANGVFLPLEVALNRAWGVPNRSLWKNQGVSMLLIFGCGGLGILSAAFVGANLQLWSSLQGANETLFNWIITFFFKLFSVPVTVLVLFLIYWKLPNTKVPARLLLPRALVVGLCLEALKWVNLAIWPWLMTKLRREYGPFVNSVTILLWSFFAALVVLVGGYWAAARSKEQQAEELGAARET